MPCTRYCSSAWEETSITTRSTRASAIVRSRRNRSTDSGVVRSVCRLSLPIMLRMVPMMPTFLPACSAMALTM